MSFMNALKSFQSTTAAEAAERDKELLTDYRRLLSVAEPSKEELAALLDLMPRLRLDAGDVEADQTAIARAIALHAAVSAAAARWTAIEKDLWHAQIGQLRLLDPNERAIAVEQQRKLEAEQLAPFNSTRAAIGEVTKLRQDNPRVSAVIAPVPTDAIPSSVLKSSPMLLTMLAAAVQTWGAEDQKAQYLRFRNSKLHSSGGWLLPESGGVVALAHAFARQIKADLEPTRELLNLLASESGFRVSLDGR